MEFGFFGGGEVLGSATASSVNEWSTAANHTHGLTAGRYSELQYAVWKDFKSGRYREDLAESADGAAWAPPRIPAQNRQLRSWRTAAATSAKQQLDRPPEA
jgi:hypothetical protein